VNYAEDNDYAARATTNTGDTLHSGVKESGLKPVNRLLAKTLAADPDSLDGTPEGTLFKRPAAGFIDTSGGIKRLQSYDTRSVNDPPSAYAIGVTSELKDGNVLGVPGHSASTFGTLLTEKSWNDASAGNAIKQTFHSAFDNQQWRRYGVPNAGSWSGTWRIVTETQTQRYDRDTGHLLSTMQESGAKPVNRLLAKTLAADA
jgi:hypothetical protein